MPQPSPGPTAAPMAQPTPNAGNAQMGKVRVSSALQLLTQALQDLGATSLEGQAVVRAMGNLAKHFGRSKDESLVPAQLSEMVRANQGGQLQGLLQQQQQQPPPPMGAQPGA